MLDLPKNYIKNMVIYKSFFSLYTGNISFRFIIMEAIQFN